MTGKPSEIIWSVPDVIKWEKIPLDLVPCMKKAISRVEEGINEEKPIQKEREVSEINTPEFTEEELNILREHLKTRLVDHHWLEGELRQVLDNIKKGVRMKRFAR